MSNLQELNLALLITYYTKHTHMSGIHNYIMSTQIHLLLFFDSELLSLCFAFWGEERTTKINKIWSPHQEINFKKNLKKEYLYIVFHLNFTFFSSLAFLLSSFHSYADVIKPKLMQSQTHHRNEQMINK